MKKNQDDNDKTGKLKSMVHDLKKIQNCGQEEDKNKLKDAFDHWRNIKELRDNNKNKKNYLDKRKDITDRGKIKDKLFDRAEEKNALDHWKNIKELRDIMDRLKKWNALINGFINARPRKYLMHLKIWKKRNISINFKDKIYREIFLEQFNGLLNKKNFKNNLDKWKETADKRNILEKIKPYQKKE